MRATSFVRILIGIANLLVIQFHFEGSVLVAQVRPTWRRPRCSNCKEIRPGYDKRDKETRWVHLSIGELRIVLAYAPRRVNCPDCGVRVEEVPWAEPDSRFTRPLEEMTGYLAQNASIKTVSALIGISWTTVRNIIARLVARKIDTDRLEELKRIGIDEFSFRKRHRYITIVVDHEKKRVVWAKAGKDSGTLGAFFDELGQERAAKLEVATIDMSAAFIKSLKEKAPNATMIFDRFHVHKLVSKAVDEVRTDIVRSLTDKDTEEAAAVKRSKFVLLKNPANLSTSEWIKLNLIEQLNEPLYRAYLLKESFAVIFDEALNVDAATRSLDQWLQEAERSELTPFIKVAATIQAHKTGILAYFKNRDSNGRTEGINNKIRSIARRAFGFHSAEALIGMVFLCCGGIVLNPPLPGPWCTF